MTDARIDGLRSIELGVHDLQKSTPQRDYRRILIGVGWRSLGEDIQRALTEGINDGLDGTQNLPGNPLGNLLCPA